MYQHDDIGHEFLIYTAEPKWADGSILHAPPVILSPDFACRDYTFADTQQGALDDGLCYGKIRTLTTLPTHPQLIMNREISSDDIPILLSCAAASDLFGLNRDFTTTKAPWKLFQCRITAKSLWLNFISIEDLRKSHSRRYAELTFNQLAILQIECRISYEGSKHTHGERYTCVTSPCTAGDRLAKFRIDYQRNSLLKRSLDPEEAAREISTSQIKCSFEDSYR